MFHQIILTLWCLFLLIIKNMGDVVVFYFNHFCSPCMDFFRMAPMAILCCLFICNLGKREQHFCFLFFYLCINNVFWFFVVVYFEHKVSFLNLNIMYILLFRVWLHKLLIIYVVSNMYVFSCLCVGLFVQNWDMDQHNKCYYWEVLCLWWKPCKKHWGSLIWIYC
jgi:hypothetical protein